jgi:hypothetical protein
MPQPTITLLERRKIQAEVFIPMLQAFQLAMGKEQANEIARQVIFELARKDGARLAQQFGDDLAGMEKVSGVWAAGGSLDIEPIEKSTGRLDFNVTRCQFAEFYKALGAIRSPSRGPARAASRPRAGCGRPLLPAASSQ